MSLTIPRRLAEDPKRRNLDPEPLVVDFLVSMLEPDPHAAAESHLELAVRYLEEGKNLIDTDPVQASEKLYKVAEEAVKALTTHFNLKDILEDVEKSGTWSLGKLEKAVLSISDKVGDWFRSSWDTAWALHVWGFHEAKFDAEDVRRRLPSIDRMVTEAQRIAEKK
ncbi:MULTISPECIES: PaREP1 family protein [Thermofilum]|uniref:Superfamily I DNA and RNA helicase and helicaseubunit n=2 Tax=Thermofilum adornatum TaxID=1365176 RepID=S6A5Z2_9CREN|nr:PaREP1 family protein [Thermofilum adornatum]AGT35922.1 hypothetical protein N186_07920 [Thermofilum adornatum]AJB41725.1 PaREP1 family protein [Thermofilum adornatum 1505]